MLDPNPPSIRPPKLWARSDTGAKLEHSNVSLAQALSERLAPCLETKDRKAHVLLLELALDEGQRRGYRLKVDQVVFLMPQEIIMAALGIKSRHTILGMRRKLEALGLIQTAALQAPRSTLTTPDGGTKTLHYRAGVLWAVSLKPLKRARLRREDFNHGWRDMRADIKTGRTAFTFLQNAHTQLSGQLIQDRKNIIKTWTLRSKQTPPVNNVYVHSAPSAWKEAVLDAITAPRPDASRYITLAASALIGRLGDSSRYYGAWAKLLLRLRWLFLRGQDYTGLVLDMLSRVIADREEGFARSPGALFNSRLKACFLGELLKATPHSLGVA